MEATHPLAKGMPRNRTSPNKEYQLLICTPREQVQLRSRNLLLNSTLTNNILIYKEKESISGQPLELSYLSPSYRRGLSSLCSTSRTGMKVESEMKFNGVERRETHILTRNMCIPKRTELN